MDTLVKKVEQRVAEIDSDAMARAVLTPELKAAIRLSDQFEDLKPKEYILPLDALAGFSLEAKAARRIWR